MDIYEGDFIFSKIFQVTNLRAGTNFPTDDGGEMYCRLTLTEIDNNTLNFWQNVLLIMGIHGPQ